MNRREQIAEASKLLAHLEHRTAALAEGIHRNPVTDYTCLLQAARERELFFRNGPRPNNCGRRDCFVAPLLAMTSTLLSLRA